MVARCGAVFVFCPRYVLLLYLISFSVIDAKNNNENVQEVTKDKTENKLHYREVGIDNFPITEHSLPMTTRGKVNNCDGQHTHYTLRKHAYSNMLKISPP